MIILSIIFLLNIGILYCWKNQINSSIILFKLIVYEFWKDNFYYLIVVKVGVFFMALVLILVYILGLVYMVVGMNLEKSAGNFSKETYSLFIAVYSMVFLFLVYILYNLMTISVAYIGKCWYLKR
jgi:hypothetical protein